MKIFLTLAVVAVFFFSRYQVQKQQEIVQVHPDLIKQDMKNLKNSSKYR
jgi:hypothetical protein